MDPPETAKDDVSQSSSEQSDTSRTVPMTTTSSEKEDLSEQVQGMAKLQRPNMPNINLPEKIILCLDVCDNPNSLYRLADGTTFTPINMLKRVLNFFLYSKNAINRKTEFAVVVLKATKPCWLLDLTGDLKDVRNTIEMMGPEECVSETFDLKNLFELIIKKVAIPEYKEEKCVQPPSYVVRMILMYGRSKCIPLIPKDDEYFKFLMKQVYFYTDILLSHENDCSRYKCEEIYNTLQELDNGYSYVYEASRNATKIHECVAKLLAHPLQRPLQKNTNYTFGSGS